MRGYTVVIANLPLIPNKKAEKFVQWVGELDGFIGIHTHYPDGTMLIFQTENHAKTAKNLIENYGVHTGRNIGEVYFETEVQR